MPPPMPSMTAMVVIRLSPTSEGVGEYAGDAPEAGKCGGSVIALDRPEDTKNVPERLLEVSVFKMQKSSY
jgi:hypothetical protein